MQKIFCRINICSYLCEQIKYKKNMANKDYSIRQEQLARFAKAMGHPARIAFCNFLPSKRLVILATFMRNFLLQRLQYPNI